MGLLEADSVKKVYGGRVVVKSVSLTVEPGRITGLLGPNGAGKTTTFYMVVGAVRPDQGQIRLDGKEITRLPMHARARLGIGYLAQEASVFRDLSVWDNVLAILEFMGLSWQQRQRKTQELLEELSLMHVKDSLGRALSGGERRRAEIARTLAGDPLFILLDEPFAGVDPIAVGEIQRIVSYLKGKGLGILITDHNVRETLSICDHTYVMNAGEILVEGGAADIISNPQARKIYLGEDFAMTGMAPASSGLSQVVNPPPEAPESPEEPESRLEPVRLSQQPLQAAVTEKVFPSEPPPPPPAPEVRDVPPVDSDWNHSLETRVEAVWPPPPGEPVLRGGYDFGPDLDEELPGGERLFQAPTARTRRTRSSLDQDAPWPDLPDSDPSGGG